MQILRFLAKKRVYKTLFILFFTALFIVPTFLAAVHAADVTDQSTYQQEVRQGEEQAGNLQMTVSATGTFLLNFALNQLAGCYGTPAECQDSRFLSDGGAVGGAANLIAMTYANPAANTQTYIADLMQDMGVAQPVYAQGLGFSSLQPILQLWKVMRNIAYVFFVIIFLVIGFAIMFRQNLGSQTAVTIQQALPKIVVALLAVTFSYAIAGLLIDLMYVVMFFLIAIFQASGLVSTEFVSIPVGGVAGDNNILSQNIFQVGWAIISSGVAVSAGSNVGELISNALGGGLADIVGFVSSVLVTVVLFVAILIGIFKTFLALLKVYFEIVLSIVFAPVILMLSAIDGSAVINWIKGLVANLLVFPALLLFILIGYMFMGIQGSTANVGAEFSSGGFLPPFIPGRGNAQQISLLMGVAVILLMAEVPSIVGKFKPKGPFDELAGTAFRNATAGEIGLPVAGAALGTGLGVARVTGIPGLRRVPGLQGTQEWQNADWRSRLKLLRTGADVDGRRVGGVLQGFSGGWNVGQGIRKRIDDAQDNRLLEPDNTRAMIEKLIKGQEGPKKDDIPPKPKS